MTPNLFKDIEQADFLAHYWQQKPYVFKQAYHFEEAPISGDDLAYLACDDAIESRFVFTDAQESQWHVEHGPFSEARFSSLPDKHWTLMVQSVDQWVPELHELLKGYDFLPSWRLDDLLATYATEGGGVGPHFDYYDVFLIQASGQRRWKIGQHCDSNSLLRKHQDIKLLDHFAQLHDYVLSPGDVLYVPPKIAHWGTALSDDCTTLSVGFRAPSESDLIADVLKDIDQFTTEDHRYQDDLTMLMGPAMHEISPHSQQQAQAIVKHYLQSLSNNPEFLATVAQRFAQQVTTPRNLNIIEPEDDITPNDTIQQAIATQRSLDCELDAACRAAYTTQADHATLYFNGNPHTVTIAFAKGLCSGKIAAVELQDNAQKTLLLDWANRGFIYLN